MLRGQRWDLTEGGDIKGGARAVRPQPSAGGRARDLASKGAVGIQGNVKPLRMRP